MASCKDCMHYVTCGPELREMLKADGFDNYDKEATRMERTTWKSCTKFSPKDTTTRMSYTDSVQWLKSLKHQIGQSQHQDLWHFEQAIAEIIELLQPLTRPHGRLIDADTLEIFDGSKFDCPDDIIMASDVWSAPTIIEAEE